MADKAETIGYGSSAYIDDGADSAFVVIDNLLDYDAPAEKLGVVESKRLDTPNRRIVKIPTLYDGGECQFNQQFTQAGFERMEGLKGVDHNLKFTTMDDTSSTSVEVSGFITQNKIDKVEADKISTFTTMFTVSGEPTETEA